MARSFLQGITPFIGNMSKKQIGKEPSVQKIKENGTYICPSNKVKVEVESNPETPSEVLTPEAQQEIISEEF